jgi:hypothetical protein
MVKAPLGGGHGKDAKYRLENQAQGWKTPTVAEGDKIGNAINSGQLGLSNDPLLEQGVIYHTPTAREARDGALLKEPKPRKDGTSRREDTLGRAVQYDDAYRGFLNPRWVEALMGVPEGWVDPFESGPLSLTNRTDELRLLGNGVVPSTAERAVRVLLPRLFSDKVSTIRAQDAHHDDKTGSRNNR